MRYQHLFFDLDRTLWDFETNSRNALRQLYDNHKLNQAGIEDADTFIAVYEEINERMWSAYRLGNINKQQLRAQRFGAALAHFDYRDEKLSELLDREYIRISPYQKALLPEALETVGYLSERYKLHIITNGFEEVQEIKMRESGLLPYFENLLTSERAMTRKPDPYVFKLACKMADTSPADSLMIGDDLEADIRGARGVNMDQVYFNPPGKAHEEIITYEIRSLSELREFL